MELQQLKLIIEGALLAAGEPLSNEKIMQLFQEGERPRLDEIKQVLAALQEDYENRALEIKEVASGYRIHVKQLYAPWISRLWEEKPARYSRALLETLSLVAYRQPITRAEIEEVRGVTVSPNIIRTLLEREWIRVVGHREVPGRPELFATTKEFLDYFNLKHLHELPPLPEIRDLDQVEVELQLPSSPQQAPVDASVEATTTLDWEPDFLDDQDLKEIKTADEINKQIEALLTPPKMAAEVN